MLFQYTVYVLNFRKFALMASEAPFIVGLGGTTRPLSSSEFATRAVLGAAEALGARTEMFDGAGD